jgi:acyl-CoA reductase-like NAD-dependent aldehyde dehydrogenase
MSEWTKFQGDFNALTDEEVSDVTRRMEDQLEEAEDWLEAVAAWEAAGRPRTIAKGEDRNG